MLNTNIILSGPGQNGNPLLNAARAQGIRANDQAMAQAKRMNPLLIAAQEAQNKTRTMANDEAEYATKMQRQQQAAQFLYQGATALKKLPFEQRWSAVQPMLEQGRELGIPVEMLTPESMTDDQLNNTITGMSALYDRLGTASAGYKEFLAKTQGLSKEDQEKALRIDLGLDPRATGSGALTIAQLGLTPTVASSEATIAGAKAGASEQATSDVQVRMQPKIRSAIKEAETVAAARGEELTAYARAEAALPGLQEVVQKLKTLADVSTYTMAGKAFNEVVKQLGFGATEGATARASMISIVDNQVLPLLRDTFGAAFTEAEGQRLRDTLLNPDAPPEQMKAQLDAFLAQKMRDLEVKQRSITGMGNSQQEGKVKDFSTLSNDELLDF